MSTLAAMGAVAVLFVVFGLLRLRAGADCGGGGCASCGAICHRRRTPEEEHHVS